MSITFIVHVAGPRIVGTFHRATTAAAITKALAMECEGRVFITDPNGDAYVSIEFPNLMERSFRKRCLEPKDHLAQITISKVLGTFTAEELRRLVTEMEERLRRANEVSN